METKLIKIGNSKGLRLPKSFIKQFDLENKMMQVEANSEGIWIKPIKVKAREGWEEQFKQSVKTDDEKDLSVGFENEFDQTEWVW